MESQSAENTLLKIALGRPLGSSQAQLPTWGDQFRGWGWRWEDEARNGGRTAWCVQFHCLEELGQTWETSSLSPTGLCVYSVRNLDLVTTVLNLAYGDFFSCLLLPNNKAELPAFLINTGEPHCRWPGEQVKWPWKEGPAEMTHMS